MLVYPRSRASSTPCGRITRTATAQTRTARCTSSIFTPISSRSQGDSRRQHQQRLRQQHPLRLRLPQERRPRRPRQPPGANRPPPQALPPPPPLVKKGSGVEKKKINLEAPDLGE